MADPRIPLKNQYLAAVLAYLVPGAGHFYQGRAFKGALYFVCILGTYLFGLYVSDWKAVYWRWEPGHKNVAYFAQAGVGMFAIPAYLQAKRYNNPDNFDRRLEGRLSAQFGGRLYMSQDDPQTIVGRMELEPHVGDFGREIRGTLTGRVFSPDGRSQPIELNLSGPVTVDPRIGPGSGRKLACDVLDDAGNHRVGEIDGAIPRSFANHFATPLQDEDLRILNGNLHKFYELAKIFTWIAGLLNILAVWDALEGPAYGYGDEEESPGEGNGEQSAGETKAGDSPAEQSAAKPEAADKAAAKQEPVT